MSKAKEAKEWWDVMNDKLRGHRVVTLQAAPGSGKTYGIKKLLDHFKEKNVAVVAVKESNVVDLHRELKELRNSRAIVDVFTVAQLIQRGAEQHFYVLVVVDEAQDVNDKSMAEDLWAMVKSDTGCLVLLGDDGQLLHFEKSGFDIMMDVLPRTVKKKVVRDSFSFLGVFC